MKNKRLSTMRASLIFTLVFLTAAISAQAATFVVDRNDDDGGQTACTAAANDCTLRGAMSRADQTAEADTITFAANVVSGFSPTILLEGELVATINGALTITNSGNPKLNIVQFAAKRILLVQGSSNVTIRNLTFTGGNGTGQISAGNGFGGAIFNGGTLTMFSSIISGANAELNGGGIFNTGHLTLVGGEVRNNSTNNSGGGIGNQGTLTISNAKILNNRTVESGGGVFNTNSGTATIENTTIDGNQTTSTASNSGLGGGIGNLGNLTINSSTISHNQGNNGGGIFNQAIMSIVNSTISSNSATNGGGINNNGSAGETNMTHTTVVSNTASVGNQIVIAIGTIIRARNSIFGSGINGIGYLESQGYNLFRDSSANPTGNTTGNIKGVDPNLSPLQDNGGTTETHIPLPGSPAIDAADPNNVVTPDQIGNPRPLDGNGDMIARSDIGAVEVDPTVMQTLVVNKTDDHDDGVCDTTDCTIREAVNAANNFSGKTTINFSSSFTTAQNFAVTNGELVINANVKVDIIGRATNLTTLLANGQNRIFNIKSGAMVNLQMLTIKGGTVSGGNGGGIYNQGNLTLNQIAVSNNSAFFGGGLCGGDNSTTSLMNSTVSNNTATSFGGGIAQVGAGNVLIITTSTINNNNAATGGGLYIDGTATIVSSTVSSNSATSSSNFASIGGGILISDTGILNMGNSTVVFNTANKGGGILNNDSGTAGITQSSIIARNSAPTNPDYSGNFNSRGNNLIQNTAGITGTFAASDITGVDPLLNPLADYGGPTKTHQLMPTSPAIDKGVSAGQTTDQRGFTRKVDFETPNGAGDGTDIGAFELQVLTPVVTSFTISGSNPVRANTSVTFTVTFNRNVNGVDLSDFQLITTGNITNAQITGFTGGAGGSVVMITVSTGTTEPGTIQLRLVDDDSIRAISDNAPLGGAGAGNGSANSEILAVSLPDVTAPGNPITQIGTDSPYSERAAMAIDNTTDKYLNFGGAGSGFTVTPSSGSVVTSLRFYTASDSPERDPASYILEGSNDGGTTWIQISAGNLALPDGRNAAGQPLTASGLVFQTVSFSNTVGYTSYRLTFPTLKGTGENLAMQIGEVEFPGTPLGTTAANATISGRVISGHRGVSRAVVQMTDQSGNVRTARTNAFGYYSFAEVEVGQIYIVSVFSKQYQFTPQVVNLTDNLTALDFYSQNKFQKLK